MKIEILNAEHCDLAFIADLEKVTFSIPQSFSSLEKMLLAGEITEEEYRERKAVYVETILELYVKGILTKEEMQERLNK